MLVPNVTEHVDGLVLRYDAARHVYYLNETEATSVTQACHEGGLGDEFVSAFWTEDSRERGVAIHDALLVYFRTQVQPPPGWEYEPYWWTIMAFLNDGGFEVEQAETFIADGAAMYAGRFDFTGRLKRYALLPGIDLVDVKTGTVPRTVKAQTAGYRRRLKDARVRRWALKVTPEHYRLVPLNTNEDGRIDLMEDRRDEADFLAALRIAQFRRRFARVSV